MLSSILLFKSGLETYTQLILRVLYCTNLDRELGLIKLRMIVLPFVFKGQLLTQSEPESLQEKKWYELVQF